MQTSLNTRQPHPLKPSDTVYHVDNVQAHFTSNELHEAYISFQSINRLFLRLAQIADPSVVNRCLSIKKLMSTYSNDTDCINRLRNASALLFGMHDKYWNTALHFATISNAPTLVRFFVLTGFNPNEPNCAGNTSLHLAVGGKKVELVRILLSHNARPSCRNDNGATALEKALSLKAHLVAKEILDAISSLDQAISKNKQFEFLYNLLLEQNPALFTLAMSKTHTRHCDDFGRTLLYHATTNDLSLEKNALLQLGHTKLFRYKVTARHWDKILYHFIGKAIVQKLHPSFDTNSGGAVSSLYLPLAHVWKSFITSVEKNPQVFSKTPDAFKRSKSFLYKMEKAVELASTNPSPKKILELIQAKESPVFIPCGWKEHSMVIGIYSHYIFWANRGEQSLEQTSNFDVALFDPEKLTESMIGRIQETSNQPYEMGSHFLFTTLKKILACRPTTRLRNLSSNLITKDHVRPTCVISNGKLCYLGGLTLGRLCNKVFLQEPEIKPFYKAFTTYMRELIILKSGR